MQIPLIKKLICKTHPNESILKSQILCRGILWWGLWESLAERVKCIDVVELHSLKHTAFTNNKDWDQATENMQYDRESINISV